jgi:hypothetical protein
MQTLYADLAAALDERLRVIADQTLRAEQPDVQLRRLQIASEKIELLKRQLPADADPRLRHYLERMSLSKALDYLRTAGLAPQAP